MKRPSKIPLLLPVLAAVPGLLSAYLLWLVITGESAAGCGFESSCQSVLSSRWSRWLGLPVGALALPVYLGIIFGLIALRRGLAEASRLLSGGLVAASVAILGAGAWFIAVQAVDLHAFCPWCLATHTLGACTAAWTLQTLRKGLTPPIRVGFPAGVGVLGVGVLVLGQVLFPPTGSPKPDARASLPGARIATNGVAIPVPARPIAEAHPPRQWVVPISGVTISLGEVPVLGNPGATNLLLHLFDYTCKHCRAMHPHLMGVLDRYSNDVAVVSLPVPLDMECNPLLKKPIPEHVNACAIARVGLALWRASPAALRSFDDWIAAQPQTVSPDAAEAEAVRMVGVEAIRRAKADPAVDQLIQLSISLYTAHYRVLRKQNLPELLVGTNLLSGPVASARDLQYFVASRLNLDVP